MAGIEGRVKKFLESWAKIRENTPLSMDPLRCVACDRELEDGGFALLDGDPVCLKCGRDHRKPLLDSQDLPGKLTRSGEPFKP